MRDSAWISSWQERLAQSDPAEAWREFLVEYGPLMLQVAREIEADPDHASDAWLFACERLADDRFRRLRQFNPSGTARFATWLRAVTCNLVLDARRRRLGRLRPLAAVRRGSVFEQRVFACRDQGLSVVQTVESLAAEFPDVTPAQVADAERAVLSRLSPHDHWLLAGRHTTTLRLADLLAEDASEPAEFADTAPDPERAVLDAEERTRLENAVAELPPADRLVLELRFSRGLTLARVATILQLKDQWAADRRIKDVLRRLRTALDAMA